MARRTPTNPKTRRFSESQKRRKMEQVADMIAKGHDAKSAIKKAGISTPSYYKWRKAINLAVHGEPKPCPVPSKDTTDPLVEMITFILEYAKQRDVCNKKIEHLSSQLIVLLQSQKKNAT